MKPEPYLAPPPKKLTELQRKILITSAGAKGGPYPVGIYGAGQFTAARALVAMRLGEMDGKKFTSNARGAAAIKEEGATP